MLTIYFFAFIREILKIKSLELKAEYLTVSDLREALIAQGESWRLALGGEQLLISVNHTIVDENHPLQAGDEIGFFPPVTGG